MTTVRAIRIPGDVDSAMTEVQVDVAYPGIGLAITGTDRPCMIERVQSPTLRALAWPDQVFSYGNPNIDLWVDEEGLLRSDPVYNLRASYLAQSGYHLAGDAILIGCDLVDDPEEGYKVEQAVDLPKQVTVESIVAVMRRGWLSMGRRAPD